MKFSIVTISFNQAAFLEKAICSVLDQDYDNLEYIVVDPGSTDGSREIIERYRDRITKIIYEPDNGPADGLNKGFTQATGDLYGFLNSDDTLLPGTLQKVANFFDSHPTIDLVSGHTYIIDEHDNVLRKSYSERFTPRKYAYGAAVLMQASTFFRAAAYKKTQGLNENNTSSWDGELFLDMCLIGSKFYVMDDFLSCFRMQAEGITASMKLDANIRAYSDYVFKKVMGRNKKPYDIIIRMYFRLLKHLSSPRALFERLRKGPIYGRLKNSVRTNAGQLGRCSDNQIQPSAHMKLLHIIPSMNPAGGGPVEGVKKLIEQYKTLGVQSEIAVLDDPDTSPWLNDIKLPLHALGPSALKFGYSSKLLPWLKAHAMRYDAVIVEGLWQYHGYAVRKALRGTSTPYYVFTHGMLDPWFKHTYPLKHLKKWLYWPWGEYQVLRDAKAVLFTCEEERILARKSFWLYKCNEIVVGYGTSKPSGDATRQRELFLLEFPELTTKRLFLYLSRIHVKKGCDLLIEAFAKVAKQDKALHLVMAGPDQSGWQKELVELSRDLGVEKRITWTGMLSGDLKWGAYHAAEAFILPSHQENFGVVVAEALACGLPVLISNKVNIWREVEADGAGIVTEDTLEGTVDLFEEWLAKDATAQAAMREKAVACFESRFEMGRAAKKLIEVIGENNG